MKRTLLIIAFIFAIALTASAQSNPPLTITEADGTPSKTNATKLVFQSGTLSIVGGVITYTAPVAAGTVTTTGGTPNTLPKWLTSTTLGDSPASADGTNFTIDVSGTAGNIVLLSNGLNGAIDRSPITIRDTAHGNTIENGQVILGAYGGTGVTNAGKTITLGGNLVTSGAFSTTITSTATTNSTLPAGTHSLAPLDSPAFVTGLSSPAITDSGLTAGRVTFAGTGGLLSDDADMTFSTDTLTVTKLAVSTLATIPTPFTLGAVSVTATGTELNYSAGVTSAIQTQLNGKQASGSYAASGANSDITSLSGVTGIAGGASNMTITSGTGNSRTMILRTTTSGGTATTALTLGADQAATFTGALSAVDATFTGHIVLGAAQYISFNGRGALTSPSDGVLFLQNNAGSDFGRLQLGGTTSSFPSIKRSAATLAFRLADDSADASFSGKNGTFSGHLIGASATPTIANGAGAGTSPGTPAIAGTDMAGQITIITGTLPSVSAVAVTVTFNATYGTAPYVVIWPANAAAATLGFLPYVGSTTTTFTVNAGTIALGAATTYLYNFVVVQ